MKSRKRAAGLIVTLAAGLVLSACLAQTGQATNVTPTSATLNATVSCSGGTPTPCEWYWEWGTGGSYQNQSQLFGPYKANVSSIPLSYAVTGLAPSTTYQYTLCGEGDQVSSIVCVPSSSFTTAAEATTTTTAPTTTTTTTTIPPTSTTTVPPTTTTTTQPSGLCNTPPYQATLTTGEGTWGDDPYWVNQDEWASNQAQTMNVCSPSSWAVTTTQSNVGGEVRTYPDTEYDVGGRDGGTTKPISAFNNITSTFAEQNPTSGNDGWDAGYDLWTNGWSNETMIWNQWAGSQSFWPSQANGPGGAALTLNGVPYHFFPNGSNCNTTNVGGCELMFFRDTQTTSGSVDLLAAFNWEVSHGYAKASDVPTQLEYGTEVCYTQGSETFNVTGLTFNVS